MNCLFLIEIYFGLRSRITELAVMLRKTRGVYAKLHGLTQEIMIVAIATIVLVFVTLFLFWRQGAARLAASITIAVSALFAIEMVSLHAVDAVFYRPIGPVLMLGWVWVIATAGICAATQFVIWKSRR